MKSPIFDGNNADAELRELDNEISHLCEAIRQLRTRRNTLVPISKLPNEILLVIFETIVQETRDSNHMNPITLVCERWNQVAMEYAVLWSYLNFTDYNIKPELCARSKRAPLTLDITLDSFTATLAKTFLSENIDRVRDLDLGLCHKENDLHPIICNPMPLLEVARLTSQEDAPLQLPGLFGGDRALCLRELHLYGVSTNCFPSFTHLTHLTVMNDPQLDPLLALAHMPCLQVLDLSLDGFPGCPDDYAGNLPNPGAIIRLPALHKCTVAAELTHCAYLFNHLRLPASTYIDLFTLSTLTSGIVHPPTIMQFIANRPSEAVERLRVICQDHTFRFSNTSTDWMTRMRCVAENLAPALHALSQSTRFESLELKLECWDSTVLDWSKVFLKLEGVRRIEINLHDAEKMLKTLTTSTKYSHSSGTPRTSLLPQLEELTVSIMAGDDNSDDDRFDQLIDFLRSRKAAGLALSQLRVMLGGEAAEAISSNELAQLGELLQVTIESFDPEPSISIFQQYVQMFCDAVQWKLMQFLQGLRTETIMRVSNSG